MTPSLAALDLRAVRRDHETVSAELGSDFVNGIKYLPIRLDRVRA